MSGGGFGAGFLRLDNGLGLVMISWSSGGRRGGGGDGGFGTDLRGRMRFGFILSLAGGLRGRIVYLFVQCYEIGELYSVSWNSFLLTCCN